MGFKVFFIDNTLSKIDLKINNPEIQKVEELLTFLEKLKTKSEIELKNIVHRRMMILENGLRERFLNNSSEEEISEYLERFLNNLVSQIESKLEKISKEIEIKVDRFSKDISEITIRYDKIKSFNRWGKYQSVY